MRVQLFSTLLLAAAFAAQGEVLGPDTPIVSTSSVGLTYSEAVAELEQRRGDDPRASAPTVRQIRSVLAALLRDKAMAEETLAEGLDKRPDVAARLERARRAVLKQVFMEEKTGSIEEAKLEALARDYYDTHRREFRVRPEIEVSHILFGVKCEGVDQACNDERAAKKAQAKQTLGELLAGADFAQLAEERSDDTNSARLGGKIPFALSPPKSDPEFWKAAWALEPGEMTGVVESRFGYHIIRLDAKTAEGIPAFYEVKQGVMKQLNQEQLRARAAEIDSEFYQSAFNAEWDVKALEALTRQFTPTDEKKAN